MRVLVTGAAGMIGRKLVARLVQEAGHRRSRDHRARSARHRSARCRNRSFSACRHPCRRPLRARGGGKADARRSRTYVFHLAGVVSGEAEANFALGYSANLDGARSLFHAVHEAGHTSQIGLLVVHRRVRRTVSGHHCRRFPLCPAGSYGTQKVMVRGAACRLHAARVYGRGRHQAAHDQRATRQAQQGGLRLLLQHHPRAACRPRGGAARAARRGADPCQPALGGEFPAACRATRRCRDRPGAI
jgi:hypothetical protein